MADKKKSLSLNDRHNHRLLQSSSSPSKAPSNPPGEEEEEESKSQKVKVKLQGRRRLCKLSSREDDDDETGGGFLNEPKFSGITDDPESPPSRIRDIVDDLSSKLHFLSIEKPKRVGGGKATLAEDLSSSTTSSHHPHPPLCVINEEGPKQKQQHQVQKGNVNVDVNLDYASADSSFSVSPDSPCRSSLDKAPLHSSVDFEKNADNEHKKKNSPKMDTKDRSIVSGNLDEDDDCLVLSNSAAKKVREKAPTRASCLVKEKEEEEEEEEVTNFISVDDYDDDDVLGDSITTSDSSVSMDDGDTFILSGKPSNYKLPGKIAKMLFPHQQDGLKWLWSLHCRGTGGILGDDMGLGKTMQICSFLAGLFHSCLIKRALVVAPKTLLAHWVKELSIVGLSEKTREYYAASVKIRQYELQYILQHSGILLTTYDIVRNNSKSLRGDCDYDDDGEESIIWDYIILDEGHIIKNPSTQRAKSLLEMPSSHRIIISGTPIQNNLKELWALFSFCCPELLGDTKEFKARYESAILRGNEKNATDREKRIGSTVAKELRERIEPYFLRRMKSEVSLENEATKSGKLSEKNEIIVWLRLTHCQRQLYEAFLKSELVLSSFDGSPLAAITVLKKICDHPLLLTKRAAEDVLDEIDPPLNQDGIGVVERMVSQLANASDSEDSEKMNHNISCKISFIISLLDNLIPEGHNVLIFSQTRKMLNLVQEAIILKGYKFLRIDGTTKASDRAKIVNDFQEGDKAPIFLLTSQVGGLGLTLTKADRVIVVDPAWNPSTDNQSVDRAYRIGQKKDVIVYRLMTCGTIEEKIYKMQVFKGGLLKTATEHKEQTRYFSQQDLRELFSLPKQGFDVSLTQQQLHEEHDYQQIIIQYEQSVGTDLLESTSWAILCYLLVIVVMYFLVAMLISDCFRNNSLKNHIMFLKSQGIAGVSNHSLLFSKTPPLQEDDELLRGKETSFVGTSSSSSSLERDIDKPEYAFNPKDVKLLRKNAAGVVRGQPTESEIKDRIKRLHDTLADKGIISKLPDKGRKIEQQIFDLNLELDKFKMAESSKKEVINIDELSDELQRVSV